MLKFIQAVLLLVGMIIGVGMFGIPFSFASAGFLLGSIELIVLAGVVLLIHVLYAELILHVREPHRLPGYLRHFLGRRAEHIAQATSIFGTVGALLAYVLIGSVFLHTIFRTWWAGSNEPFWAVLISLSAALIAVLPFKRETAINSVLTALLVGFIVALSFMLLPRIELGRLTGVHWENIFVPYGVLLFSLSGGVALHNLIALLGHNKKRIVSAITVGTIIPAAIYFFFALAIVGSSGESVSKEAILGLRAIVGERIILLGSVVGFLAVFTSLIGLGSYFRGLLEFDFGVQKTAAWLIASALPLLLYFLGFQNFIRIISGVGIFAGGVESLLIIAAYHKLTQERRQMRPRSYTWKVGIFLMVISGVVFAIVEDFF